MAFPKFQTKEVLNKVLNAGEDALNVDLSDSVTVTVDSEFPAAAAITDNFANPTTTSAMSMLMGYDGSAWDRVTIGGGTEATALRVTIASDSTGVVSIDDNGSTLTVDVASGGIASGAIASGAVASGALASGSVVDGAMVTLGAKADAKSTATDTTSITAMQVLKQISASTQETATDTGTIDADTNAIKGHVDGIETLITSTNSKIDTLDAVQDNALTKLGEIETTNNANQVLLGTIDSDTDAIKTATELIDDAIYADDADWSDGTSKHMLVGGLYGSNTITSGDVGPLALDPTGALYTREFLGQAGSILVTGTTNAVTTGVSGTKFVAIQFLEDTTFDAGSDGLVASTTGLWPDDANASATIDDNGGAVTGSEVFPQGMTIFGRWDGFKLDSGKVIGYLGYV